MQIFKKPRSRKINLDNLTIDMVSFWENATEVTKTVMEKMKIPYVQATFDAMDLQHQAFFVVLKNKEYDVIMGSKFISFLNEVPLSIEDSPKITDLAQSCRNHFIEFLVRENSKPVTNPIFGANKQ